jgi:magnesium chelatase family protein
VRSYHRVLRTARTIADLDGADGVRRIHIAEALSARRNTRPSSPAPGWKAGDGETEKLLRHSTLR